MLALRDYKSDWVSQGMLSEFLTIVTKSAETGSTKLSTISSKAASIKQTVDEPPHQIRSYTLLFSLFLHFPYIADPPLHTSAPTRPHVIALALT